MKIFQKDDLSASEKAEVLQIWNREYPEQLAYPSVEAFEEYLYKHTDQRHFLYRDEQGKVKAWYLDFMRDGARWLALLMAEEVQGKGYGSKLLELAKAEVDELNAWVIDHPNDRKQNGEIYRSPLDFYLKNGFKVMASNRMELEIISAVQLRWNKAKP